MTFTSYAFVEHTEIAHDMPDPGNVRVVASKLDGDGYYHIAVNYGTGLGDYQVDVYDSDLQTILDTYPSTPINVMSGAEIPYFYFDNAAQFCYILRSDGTLRIEKYDMADGTLDSTVNITGSMPSGYSPGGKFVVLPSGQIHMFGLIAAGDGAIFIFNSSGVYQSVYGQTQFSTGVMTGIATDGSYIVGAGFNPGLSQSMWAWDTSGSFEEIVFNNVSFAWKSLTYDATEDKYIGLKSDSPSVYAFNVDFTTAFSFNFLYPAPARNPTHANLYDNGDIRVYFPGAYSTTDYEPIASLYQIPSGPVETEFYRYDFTGNGVSLGTPDGGVSIPALDGIDLAAVHAFHIRDLRIAVENVAPYYENGTTLAAWNFDDGDDDDNLYYNAMGDRTDYGATGGARYIWTREVADMHDTPTYDIDVGEIDECVTLLEASDPL